MQIHLTEDQSPDAIGTAARIWAATTARRDGLAVPVPAEEKIAGIAAALSEPGATLHLADAQGDGVGFAITITSGSRIELRYLGVAPEAWGRGVAGAILAALSDGARAARLATFELWVLTDNHRAIEVYLRAGWTETGELKSQVDTRRVETRLQRPLANDLAAPDELAG